MNQRFRLNCAYILVLSILLHPFASNCYPEFLKDPSSNAEDSNYVVEERQSKVDPSIERIFRGPTDRKNEPTNSKRTAEPEAAKNPAQSAESDGRARLKRESIAKRSAGKSLNEATRNQVKRAAPKAGKAFSRTGRSSRDLPKLPDKDYEVSVDQDKSEYADAVEDDSVAESRSKEVKYKGGEYRVGDDSERFIDQEERSSLYDDFEAKDVVKRGISGVEDYEEMDEDEGVGPLEDTASLDDRETSDEEDDKRKIRGDVRVKREHDASKDADLAVKAEKDVTGASSEAKIADASSKREAVTDEESKAGKVAKETNDQGEQQAKRNVPEKMEADVSKANADRGPDISKQAPGSNDRTETDGSENAKFQSQDSPEAMGGDRKVQEIGLSSNEKLGASDAVGESSSLKGLGKPDLSKIAEVSNPEPSKLEVPAGILENAPPEDGVKLDGSKNEAAVGEQPDGSYEKRVEEQIQRKIDSIKEEIKREIAENQRIREIEENNAKFDELRDQEDGDDEDRSALAASPSLEADLSSEKREEPSKRSVRNAGKGQARFGPEKRMMKRKKRQGEGAKEKVAEELESRKKVRRAANKKRSSSSSSCLRELPKKREFPRQIYLVKRDRNAAKKKRKRRSKSAMLIPEQRTVKLEESLPADFALDSSLTGDSNAGGKSGAARVGEEAKAVAERDTSADKRSGSVASLTANEDDTGPLATEYGDAFGGLHGEPGVALARFKRIKRVLRPQASRS